MRISVIGAGYVGLVTAAALASTGHNVIVVDIDKDKINSINRGELPIFEGVSMRCFQIVPRINTLELLMTIKKL